MPSRTRSTEYALLRLLRYTRFEISLACGDSFRKKVQMHTRYLSGKETNPPSTEPNHANTQCTVSNRKTNSLAITQFEKWFF
eukprot:jgi/Psemu1/301409/fgenesh1_kg.33_\